MKVLSDILRALGFALSIGALALLTSPAAMAQKAPPDGAKLYNDNCASCHGADGRGRPQSQVGFNLKLPHFTDCRFATSEADGDWSSSIHNGGPARALARTMPAFGDALSDDEINAIIAHLRGFCAEPGWPRGDLNLPKALFTEKPFPEDELTITTAVATKGATDIESEVSFEKRIGQLSQLEIDVPYAIIGQGPGMGTAAGIGDITIGWKQLLLADLDAGSIFALEGEADLPTGNARHGLGTGSIAFEPHALYGQILGDYFLQGEFYAVLPLRSDVAQQLYWQGAFGRTFAEDNGYGRTWTPMVEILGERDLTSGAVVDWDVVPQMQVSLSTLQHILFSAGLRVPLNDADHRDTQFVFYFIWDWYDGGLLKGW